MHVYEFNFTSGNRNVGFESITTSTVLDQRRTQEIVAKKFQELVRDEEIDLVDSLDWSVVEVTEVDSGTYKPN